jgi:hypothetical protein
MKCHPTLADVGAGFIPYRPHVLFPAVYLKNYACLSKGASNIVEEDEE